MGSQQDLWYTFVISYVMRIIVASPLISWLMHAAVHRCFLTQAKDYKERAPPRLLHPTDLSAGQYARGEMKKAKAVRHLPCPMAGPSNVSHFVLLSRVNQKQGVPLQSKVVRCYLCMLHASYSCRRVYSTQGSSTSYAVHCSRKGASMLDYSYVYGSWL